MLEAECQGSGTNFSDYRVYQALLVLFLTSLRVETMVARNPQSRLYRAPIYRRIRSTRGRENG